MGNCPDLRSSSLPLCGRVRHTFFSFSFFNQSISEFFLCIYVQVCLHMCKLLFVPECLWVHVCACMNMWRTEVSVYLVLWVRASWDLGLGWWASEQQRSASPTLGFWVLTTRSCFFSCWLWGSNSGPTVAKQAFYRQICLPSPQHMLHSKPSFGKQKDVQQHSTAQWRCQQLRVLAAIFGDQPLCMCSFY